MSKHTPGPWLMETVSTQCGICHKIGPFPGSKDDMKDRHACLYADYPSSTNPRDIELLANARLIAAAPDFYAMAEMVLAWWDKHQYDTISGADGEEWNVHDYEPDFVTTARAAKAKADGETT